MHTDRTFTGYRHTPDCLCGCHDVIGLIGTRVEDADTPKLAAIGKQYVRFDVDFGTGRTTERIVCFDVPAACRTHNGVLLPPEMRNASNAEKDTYAAGVKSANRAFIRAALAIEDRALELGIDLDAA